MLALKPAKRREKLAVLAVDIPVPYTIDSLKLSTSGSWLKLNPIRSRILEFVNEITPQAG